MRSGINRMGKYAAKVSGADAKRRVDEYAGTQKTGFRLSAQEQVNVEHATKAVLQKNGVQPGLNHFYMDFAKKIYKLAHMYSHGTLETEACIEFRKWSSRGLNETTMDEIMQLFMAGFSCIVMACDYPAARDVEKGVAYAYGAMTGTLDRGPPWTGQLVSYAANDDGAYKKGHTTERPIIKGAACPRFTDHGDGTVTDHATGLMWQKANSAALYNWPNAIAYAEALVLAGHSDWRLPNIKELFSIMDQGFYSPAMDTAFFPLTGFGQLWSSTTYLDYNPLAFYIESTDPTVYLGMKAAETYSVRCVRGGKP